ncbi:MAG: damage-inducible mutagenesis protein, partial [Gemmatimonadetes bacterium]|nr:damage-inducible mutagenesis protein [Gemmatimonadota bacterium]
MSTVSKAKRETAEALRRAIQGIEEGGSPGRPRLPLGVPEIDRVLPGGGLRAGCIHEVTGDEAATGFCAALLARAGNGGGGRGGR